MTIFYIVAAIVFGLIFGMGMIRTVKKKIGMPVIGDGHKIAEWKKKRAEKKIVTAADKEETKQVKRWRVREKWKSRRYGRQRRSK